MIDSKKRVAQASAATIVIGLAVVLVLVSSCATEVANRDPMGETFPNVRGTDLKGGAVELPGAFSGKPVLLLVGYEQDAQFDADRWLLGLLQAKVDVEVREVPTIAGFIPGLLSSRIDEGMRKGIPDEEWASVITVYDDAELIRDFTGNQNGNNMRVILLDGESRVRWYHDRGYSARLLLDLQRVIATLGGR